MTSITLFFILHKEITTFCILCIYRHTDDILLMSKQVPTNKAVHFAASV